MASTTMRAMPTSDTPFRHFGTDPARTYEALAASVQQPPHEGSVPLWIAGSRCGWATPAAQRALAPIGQAQAGPAPAFHLGAGLSPGEELNALLARAALLLRDAGCLRGWRNELLDVFGESGCVGAIERAAMRPLGLLTRAVHLNGWTPDGRLWIARRSLTKSTDPGMWDTLVGGLVGAGEALDEALLRECDEEAGLDAGHLARRAPLRTIVRIHRRIPEGYQVEDVIAADCVLAADVQPANRDGEVMEIRAAAVDDVLRMIDAGEFTDEAALVILDDIRRRAGDRAGPTAAA